MRRTITAAILAGLSWSAMPALATVTATDTHIVVTNDSAVTVDYTVQVHDGSIDFALKPGGARQIDTVAAARVWWAVWENGVVVASGEFTPAEPHYPNGDVPDEAVADDVMEWAPVVRDVGMIREPVNDAVLIPPMVIIAGRVAL